MCPENLQNVPTERPALNTTAHRAHKCRKEYSREQQIDTRPQTSTPQTKSTRIKETLLFVSTKLELEIFLPTLQFLATSLQSTCSAKKTSVPRENLMRRAHNFNREFPNFLCTYSSLFHPDAKPFHPTATHCASRLRRAGLDSRKQFSCDGADGRAFFRSKWH